MKVEITAVKVEKGTELHIKFDDQETLLATVADPATPEDLANIEKMVREQMNKAAWRSVCELRDRLQQPKLFKVIDALRVR